MTAIIADFGMSVEKIESGIDPSTHMVGVDAALLGPAFHSGRLGKISEQTHSPGRWGRSQVTMWLDRFSISDAAIRSRN
jgi:hypothetical protein